MNSTDSFITIDELIDRGEANVQTGPFGTQLKASDYIDSGTPVINVRNIGYGNIRDAKLEFLGKRMTEKLAVHQLREGDIVFGRKGAVDRHVLISKDEDGWIQGSDCLRLRLSSDTICNRFTSFYLTTSAHKKWMEALCSFGATMASLNQDIVKRITLPLLPLITQRKIAATLTAYDDLIETNKRRIALLEKMAEEIYREWFVRMRFPGHQNTRFVKGVPVGWEIRTIGDICSAVTDGSHFSPAFVEGGKPMASVKDMHTHGFNLNSVKTISEADFEDLKRANCQPQLNDVLIAKDGSYLKHVFVWNHEYEIVILSSIAILRPDLSAIRSNFFAQVLKQNSTKSMMSGYVSGSALPRIILKDFKKMKLLIPTADLMDEFESAALTIYRLISGLLETNTNLTQTRDLLLLRLISGKLLVDNLDIHFPPSMCDEANEPEAADA